MKKLLLFFLILLSVLGKTLVADMDTEGVVGRNVAQDIQTCLNKIWNAGRSVKIYLQWWDADLNTIEFKYQVDQRVEKIKNEYCKNAFNKLNLIHDILLPPINITVGKKPLIDNVNTLIATVKTINDYPEGLDWLSLDEIRDINAVTVDFENEIKRVSNVIDRAAEDVTNIKKIVTQRSSVFNQKKIAMDQKLQKEQQKVSQKKWQTTLLDDIRNYE